MAQVFMAINYLLLIQILPRQELVLENILKNSNWTNQYVRDKSFIFMIQTSTKITNHCHHKHSVRRLVSKH